MWLLSDVLRALLLKRRNYNQGRLRRENCHRAKPIMQPRLDAAPGSAARVALVARRNLAKTNLLPFSVATDVVARVPVRRDTTTHPCYSGLTRTAVAFLCDVPVHSLPLFP